MKKNRIRLTESQLHNVIKESVRKVLSELDARTYASYAQKRAEQGQMDKAQQGRNAAANAFNKQYGYDNYQGSGNADRYMSYYKMYGNDNEQFPYVAQTYHEEPGQSAKKHSHGQTVQFSNQPQMRFNNYRSNDVVNHRHGAQGTNYEEYQDNDIYHPYDSIGRKQTDVARQMATGTGQYIKGQGWQ